MLRLKKHYFVSLWWGFLYFKTVVEKNVEVSLKDFKHNITWHTFCETGEVYEFKRTYWSRPFSPSAFHFFSSAGQQVGSFDNQFKVMCLGLHPSGPETFLCGGYSSVVKAWDSRCGKVNLINFLNDGLSCFIRTAFLILIWPFLSRNWAAGLWTYAFKHKLHIHN